MPTCFSVSTILANLHSYITPTRTNACKIQFLRQNRRAYSVNVPENVLLVTRQLDKLFKILVNISRTQDSEVWSNHLQSVKGYIPLSARSA